MYDAWGKNSPIIVGKKSLLNRIKLNPIARTVRCDKWTISLLEETLRSTQKESIKDLTKQLESLTIKSILNDKSKNIICDDIIKGTKVRFQRIFDLPTKELRKLVDLGKKDLGEGIVIIFTSIEGKVGLAVGVTDKLTNKYNAVEFVKMGSQIVDGKGGGGRPDFAQAGGASEIKINEAFTKLTSLI